MKFLLILATFIALCGAAEMQNSAAQSSGSAQNFKSVRNLAWLKDVNLTAPNTASILARILNFAPMQGSKTAARSRLLRPRRCLHIFSRAKI